MTNPAILGGRSVFLSASVPDPKRWSGEFDAREITDAVVAAARAILTAGGTLVTAAHPTIAPLLLYVAAEFPRSKVGQTSVIVYQSALFRNVMPEETLRFQRSRRAKFHLTPAVVGDAPNPSQSGASLRAMRLQMFEETKPIAGIFVGGMEGIIEEWGLLALRHPRPHLYPVGRPGGEAARLGRRLDSRLASILQDESVYPTLFRAVIDDLSRRIN